MAILEDQLLSATGRFLPPFRSMGQVQPQPGRSSTPTCSVCARLAGETAALHGKHRFFRGRLDLHFEGVEAVEFSVALAAGG